MSYPQNGEECFLEGSVEHEFCCTYFYLPHKYITSFQPSCSSIGSAHICLFTVGHLLFPWNHLLISRIARSSVSLDLSPSHLALGRSLWTTHAYLKFPLTNRIWSFPFEYLYQKSIACVCSWMVFRPALASQNHLLAIYYYFFLLSILAICLHYLVHTFCRCCLDITGVNGAIIKLI